MSHVLVPTDTSTAAQAAYPWAMQLARALKLPIRLLWVADRHRHLAHDIDEDWYPPAVAAVSERLERQADALREPDVEVEVRLVGGRTIPTLVEAVADASLVVMGTAGHTGMRRFFLGSTTARVVQLARVPVLAVPPDAESRPIRRVLLGLDLSEISSDAVTQLAPLATALDAAVDITYVDTIPTMLTTLREESFVPPDHAGKKTRLGEIRGRLDWLGQRVRDAGLVGEHTLTLGTRAAPTLVERATETGAEILALASHGRSGPARAWLGSVCDETLRLATTPVLVLHPEV